MLRESFSSLRNAIYVLVLVYVTRGPSINSCPQTLMEEENTLLFLLICRFRVVYECFPKTNSSARDLSKHEIENCHSPLIKKRDFITKDFINEVQTSLTHPTEIFKSVICT